MTAPEREYNGHHSKSPPKLVFWIIRGRHSESMSWIFVFAASKMEADPLARLLGVSRWNSGSHAGPIMAGPNQLRFFITGIVVLG